MIFWRLRAGIHTVLVIPGPTCILAEVSSKSGAVWATVNIMDASAMLRMDILTSSYRVLDRTGMS